MPAKQTPEPTAARSEQCIGETTNGERCKKRAGKGRKRCRHHDPFYALDVDDCSLALLNVAVEDDDFYKDAEKLNVAAELEALTPENVNEVFKNLNEFLRSPAIENGPQDLKDSIKRWVETATHGDTEDVGELPVWLFFRVYRRWEQYQEWLREREKTGAEAPEEDPGAAQCPVPLPVKNGPRPRHEAHPVRLSTVVDAPSGKPYLVMTRALALKERWKTNADEGSKYYAEQDAAVIYQPFPPADLYGESWWNECREQVLKALEKRFRALKSELTADVIDILHLHWLNNNKPTKAGIKLSQVCKYRNVVPNQGALRIHWQALRDARGMRLTGKGFIEAAVLEIDALQVPDQPNLWNVEDIPGADLLCIYSPGPLVAAALNESASYMAHYSPKLLHMDPTRDRDAKRLGRYLRSEWRLNPASYIPDGPRRYRTWKGHLQDAGIFPSERETRRVGDYLNSLCVTLQKLADADLLQHPPSGVTVEAWVADTLTHPEDRGPLPRTGRLEAFLSQRVHLPPAAGVAAKLAEDAARRKARDRQRAALTGSRAKQKALPAG